MRKYLLFIISLATIISAQPSDYFVKFENDEVIQVFEHSSGYYLVTRTELRNNDNFFPIDIIKTDWEGKRIYNYSTPESLTAYSRLNKPVTLLPDDGLLVVSIPEPRFGKYYRTIFSRLDSTGERTGFESKFDWIGTSSIATNDGGYFAVVHSDSIDLSILKMNSNYDEIWQKDLTLSGPTGEADSQILALFDSTYIVRSRVNMFCIDNDANILWRYDIDDEYEQLLIDDENSILVLSKHSDNLRRLSKLNYQGKLIWEEAFPKNWGDNNVIIGLNNRKEYVVGWKNIVWEYDRNGKYLRRYKITEDSSYSLSIVKSGSHNDMLLSLMPEKIFTRTNNSYESEGLELHASSESTYFLPIRFLLSWRSYNIEKLDISLSTDNGQSWYYYARDYPSNEKSYSNTLPPDFDGDSVLVRIQNSFNYSTKEETTIRISDPKEFPHYEYIAANEVLMWVGNNGDGSHDPRTDGSGFYWPGGEDATVPAIFEDGLVFGGKLNGEIRVNGNTHRQGLMPGKILQDGTPDDPSKTEYRVFKYRKGWENLPEGVERNKYQENVRNWPVALGAPFVDKNLDEIYSPEVDIPGNGADEYLFNVANGADSTASAYTYGSPPLPLQFQINVFAFDRENELENVVFKKYRIINKGDEPLTDFFISYYTDDDLGNANDDFTGCDTTLNMIYTYNADEDDESGGYGSPPPAVGHLLIQGPIIPGEMEDSAFYNSRWVKGFKNLEMSYSGGLLKGIVPYQDPLQGTYEGTLQFYDVFQCLDRDGNPTIDPFTNEPVHYMFAGDPVTETGWCDGTFVDGSNMGGSDRRNILVSGPFNFAAGDTQEVVIAILIARGTDRLNSITELRKTAKLAKEFYYKQSFEPEKEEALPNKIELSQNYPNPFNPSTKIKISIPGVETTRRVVSTKLVVYDILGREIKTLLNKKLTPGRYEVEFEGSNLSSGVYLYRLQVGDTHIVKKMMLLK